MKTIVIQLITALLGSVGFAMIFNLNKKYMPFAALGGLICWSMYLITENFSAGVFIPSVIASASAALYAEIMARVLKVPATVIFVSAIIPLIPGSTLFYTMRHAVSGDMQLFSEYGIRTLLYVLGITSGISCVWSMGYMIQKIIEANANKSGDKS